MLVDLLPEDFVAVVDVLPELLTFDVLLELPVLLELLPDLLLEDVVLLAELPDE